MNTRSKSGIPGPPLSQCVPSPLNNCTLSSAPLPYSFAILVRVRTATSATSRFTFGRERGVSEARRRGGEARRRGEEMR